MKQNFLLLTLLLCNISINSHPGRSSIRMLSPLAAAKFQFRVAAEQQVSSTWKNIESRYPMCTNQQVHFLQQEESVMDGYHAHKHKQPLYNDIFPLVDHHTQALLETKIKQVCPAFHVGIFAKRESETSNKKETSGIPLYLVGEASNQKMNLFIDSDEFNLQTALQRVTFPVTETFSHTLVDTDDGSSSTVHQESTSGEYSCLKCNINETLLAYEVHRLAKQHDLREFITHNLFEIDELLQAALVANHIIQAAIEAVTMAQDPYQAAIILENNSHQNNIVRMVLKNHSPLWKELVSQTLQWKQIEESAKKRNPQ